MEKINILISDIQQFDAESTEQHNQNNEINKEEYFNLVKRIDELVLEDFNSSQKFESFLRYWNQDIRKAERFVISDSFRGNSIDLNFFLILSNDLSGVISWLKN